MLEDFGDWLLSTVLDVWNAFIGFFESIILTVFDMQKEILFWVFDELSKIVVSIVEIFCPILIKFNPAEYIAKLPPEMLNIMGLINLGAAVQIVICAIFIRFTLQLIPFIRLGS